MGIPHDIFKCSLSRTGEGEASVSISDIGLKTQALTDKMITEAKEHSNAVPRNGPLEMAGLSQREYTPANEENKFTI